MNIVNLEPGGYNPEARQLLETVGIVVECQPRDRPELLAAASNADVLITRLANHIDAEIFARSKMLKAVVSATTGLDHIDLEAAETAEVAVLSLRGETEFLETISATAEHTWALLLSIVRRVPEASASVRSGTWTRDAFKGRQLHNRRLGIVGLGRLGRKVANYGLAFGMRVWAYDPYTVTWIDGVKRAQSLQALLTISDVLTLHVPHNASTHYMIGRPELELLPPGAILLNTSRGGLVDERALVDALVHGQIGAAGLDVLECTDRGHQHHTSSALVSHAQSSDNVLITPHIGGATFESMALTEVFMARKLIKYLHERGIYGNA